MAIRVGIDVGENSVGFATVDYDDDGWPVEILNAVVHIHDGGKDPDTGQSPSSRLATTGVARRTRRLFRRRRKRLRALDRALVQAGIPVPEVEVPQMHEAWRARAALYVEFIEDETERKKLLSLAIRHLARHRGWRNPWWTYDQLAQAPVPSESLTQTLTTASEKYGLDTSNINTMGQLVGLVLNKLGPYAVAIRPTDKAEASTHGPIQGHKVQQKDGLFELRSILQTQKVPATHADEILRAVFQQQYPHVPKERVGHCALQPDQYRAPVASLEFQEYRVRSTVANLRIGRDKHPLTEEQHDRVIEYLMNWGDSALRPRWVDVADLLDVSPRDLTDMSVDGSGGSTAVHNRTSAVLLTKYKRSSPIGKWWREASSESQAALIDIVTDLSGVDNEISDPSVADLLESIDPADLDGLSVALESGRAAYSVDTLSRLNSVMREDRVDLHEARKIAFGISDDWQPPRPSFDDPIDHPTVASINRVVRRYLMNVTERFGPPESVIVEHVRGSFMGPAALAEYKREITSNTNRRERQRALLREQGIENPDRSVLRREEAVIRQNSTCLYCGATISLTTSELDHIVPRHDGGSNQQSNLVATCISCNASKDKTPFAVWAEHSPRPGVSLEEATARVNDWQRVGMTVKQFTRLTADVKRRLALTEDDTLDERSLASTAYAAREMRSRVRTYLDGLPREDSDPERECVVYSGRTSSEARKASGVDDTVRLRGADHKSRFDRRHHAIDAAILTSLNPSVAETLAIRSARQQDHRTTKKYPQWKDFTGRNPARQQDFSDWSDRTNELARQLKAAVDNGDIPVVRPLRLTPRAGLAHKQPKKFNDPQDDLKLPNPPKKVSDPFTQAEILRIANPQLFDAMHGLSEGTDLPADEERSEKIGWHDSRAIHLFPVTKTNVQEASIEVRGGYAPIGSTSRYAQVYAWQDGGSFQFGFLRLYVGEFPLIGFGGTGSDFLTTLPPPNSQSIRTADQSLIQRIHDDTALQIGWICVNDEIEIDPKAESWSGDFRKFLDTSPEKAWFFAGMGSARRVLLYPSLLASEGVVTPSQAGQPNSRLEETPEVIRTILRRGITPSFSKVLGTPGTTIIRRTVLGRPRWQSPGLPFSWQPLQEAKRAFGCE